MKYILPVMLVAATLCCGFSCSTSQQATAKQAVIVTLEGDAKVALEGVLAGESQNQILTDEEKATVGSIVSQVQSASPGTPATAIVTAGGQLVLAKLQAKQVLPAPAQAAVSTIVNAK